MGALKYSQSNKILLKETLYNENWLQKIIADDPSILGLGDLTLIERERSQPRGRLDLLLADFSTNIRYTTEIQLGTIDESHIIRTIEYWDVERKRFPNKEHIAVIAAEDITSRFLNVINLFNNHLPIIALQLDCRTFENSLFLNFIKVLDTIDSSDDEESATEKVDRSYWTSKSNEVSIKLLDTLVKEVESIDPQSSLTYNKQHIAYGGNGKRNYVWLHPRKTNFLNFVLRFREEDTENVRSQAEALGIQILNPRKNKLAFNIRTSDLEKHISEIREFLKLSFKSSL